MLNPVIALTITDFILFKNSDELINRFKLIEKKHFIKYSDDIELIFIELPKYNKAEQELASIQDKWFFLLKTLVIWITCLKTLIKNWKKLLISLMRRILAKKNWSFSIKSMIDL